MAIDGTVTALTSTQIQALVVLMVEARDVTNTEMRSLVGFTLTGQDNAVLIKQGLVETDRSHRPFSHSLTDKGWRVAREIHTSPPKVTSSAVKTLLVTLANVQRALDQHDISHPRFFRRSAPVIAADPETAVRTAYAKITTGSGEWVGLLELRQQLADIDRAVLDETLRAMAHRADVRIIPIADTKNLDIREREAALTIGDQDNHAIAIEMP